MYPEPDDNMIAEDTASAPVQTADTTDSQAQTQNQAMEQPTKIASPNPSSVPQPNPYPSLATSGEVDLNYRLGGLIIDEVISLPLYLSVAVPRVSMIAALLDLVYWLSRDALFGGQSIGKRFAKERVVKLDGSRFTLFDSVLRNISTVPAHLISLTAYMWLTPELLPAARSVPILVWLAEIICVIVTKRRMGDFLAKTKVVRSEA